MAQNASAYQAKQVAPLLVQYVSETGKLTPSVATPHLGAVCARALSYTFVKRACNLAKEGVNFGCAEQEEGAVKNLLCVIAGLNDCGFVATIETTDSMRFNACVLKLPKQSTDGQKMLDEETQKNR